MKKILAVLLVLILATTVGIQNVSASTTSNSVDSSGYVLNSSGSRINVSTSTCNGWQDAGYTKNGWPVIYLKTGQTVKIKFTFNNIYTSSYANKQLQARIYQYGENSQPLDSETDRDGYTWNPSAIEFANQKYQDGNTPYSIVFDGSRESSDGTITLTTKGKGYVVISLYGYMYKPNFATDCFNTGYITLFIDDPATATPTAKTGLSYTGAAQDLADYSATTLKNASYTEWKQNDVVVTNPQATNAGTYNLSWTATAATNYQFDDGTTTKTGTLSTSIATATFTTTDQTKSYTYDGKDHTYALSGTDSLTLGESKVAETSATSDKISLSLSSVKDGNNAAVTSGITFDETNGLKIDKTVGSGTYTCTFNATVKKSDGTDELTTNFSDGTLTKSFTYTVTVDKATLTADMISFSDATNNNEYDYKDGNTIAPTVVVKIGDVTLTLDTDYTLGGTTNDTTTGIKTLTVTPTGSYLTGSAVSKEWKVKTNPNLKDKLSITGATKNGKNFSSIELTYNGENQYPTITPNTGTTITYSTDNSTFTDTITVDSTAGTHTIYYKATREGYDDTTGSISYTIKAKEITVTWTNDSTTYNGSEQKPTATLNGVFDSDSDKCKVTVSGGQTNAGSYTATASLTGDKASCYTIKSGDESKTFEIKKKELTVTWSDVSEKTYNKLSDSLPTATLEGLQNGESLSAVINGKIGETSYTEAQIINVGTYTLSASLPTNNDVAKNYEMSSTAATKEFKINRDTTKSIAGITSKENITTTAIVYDENPVEPSDIYTGTPTIEGEPIIADLTVYKWEGVAPTIYNESTTAPTNPGTYNLKVTYSTQNYVATKIIPFTIDKATETKIEANTLTKVNENTITGVTDAYEYSTDNGVTWIKCTGDSITGLSQGTVKLRKAETTTHKASDPIDVVMGLKAATINALPKLNTTSGDLFTVGTITGKSYQYKVDNGSWSSTMPQTSQFTDPGTYKVYYRLIGESGYVNEENDEWYVEITVGNSGGTINVDNHDDITGGTGVEAKGATSKNLNEIVSDYEEANKNVSIKLEAKPVDVSTLAETTKESLDNKVAAAFPGFVEGTDLHKEFLDIHITKSVSGESDVQISDTTKVLEICVDYDLSGGKNAAIFRYHGTSATAFNKLSEKPTENYEDGTYYADVENGKIYLYSRYYSEYVIAYATGCHTVTFNSENGSIVTPIIVKNNGTIEELPTSTRGGYRFSGWYADEGLTTAFTSTTEVTEDMTLYAKWTRVAGSYNSPKTGDNGMNPYTTLIYINVISFAVLATIAILKRRENV